MKQRTKALLNLSACHRHIQVVPFQMQAADRAVFFFHQLGAGFGCLLNHGDGGGGAVSYTHLSMVARFSSETSKLRVPLGLACIVYMMFNV